MHSQVTQAIQVLESLNIQLIAFQLTIAYSQTLMGHFNGNL